MRSKKAISLLLLLMIVFPGLGFRGNGDIVVFYSGMGGEQYGYRIPALVTTRKGTLLAFAERRLGLGDHAQNDIVLRRSEDGGRHWDSLQVIADFGKSSLNDPLAVVLSSGRILLIFQEYPYGWHTRSHGWIKMAEEGYDGPHNTKSWLVYSDDDGHHWSRPRDITRMLRPPERIAVGSPGIGIQLQRGKYKGRVILPLYLAEHKNDPVGGWTNAVAWSDDAGETWHLSGEFSREGLEGYGNEAQVAECSDGSILFVARNQGGAYRQVAVSHDGGVTWSPLRVDTGLPGTPCQGSLLAVDDPATGKHLLLQASPANKKARDHGTVRLSEDDGATWRYAWTVVPGFFAYSCMAPLPDGKIGLLYEADQHQTIRLKKFSLNRIMENK